MKYYSTNKKSGPKIQENKKNLYVNPNIRVPAQLTGYKRTSKNTAGIEKALKYKIFTYVTKPDMPRKTVSLKKNLKVFWINGGCMQYRQRKSQARRSGNDVHVTRLFTKPYGWYKPHVKHT